jgi:hypothetical protein
MAMSRPQPISILLVATTSAALHGGAAILFVPILSSILLGWSGASARGNEAIPVEAGMVLALLAPLIAFPIGFVVGAIMAFAHNAFANCQREVSVEISEPGRVQAASLGNVA